MGMWSRLGRLSPTTRNWLNLDWYKLCSSWKSPGPFGITSSLQAFGKVEEGSLRSLPVFSPSYKEEQYMTRREYKKKERLKEEWPGEEEEEDVDEEKGQNEVPQAVFRKKMRTTGTAPKLFRHLYPDSEYFYLGKGLSLKKKLRLVDVIDWLKLRFVEYCVWFVEQELM